MFETAKKVAVLAVVAMLVGCGSQTPQAPAKTEPAFTAQVKTLDTMTVVVMAKTGPYSGAGQAIMDLFGWAGKANVKPAGMPFGVYYSAPNTPPESMKFEVCIPVAAETKPDAAAGVDVRKFGGIQVAATEYIGAYEQVGPTYEKLAKWIADNGYQVAGPAIEFYLSDPSKTPAESLRSEVAFPVQAQPAKTQ